MNPLELFYTGIGVGAIGGITLYRLITTLLDTSMTRVRRDRRNRLELPGDRVYRGRR